MSVYAQNSRYQAFSSYQGTKRTGNVRGHDCPQGSDLAFDTKAELPFFGECYIEGSILTIIIIRSGSIRKNKIRKI